MPLDYIQGARFLHVSGISQAISDSACDTVFAALEAARETGVTFDGVFLTQLTQRKDIIEAARLANTAAALSTQDHGAIASIPTPDQIQAALTQS